MIEVERWVYCLFILVLAFNISLYGNFKVILGYIRYWFKNLEIK